MGVFTRKPLHQRAINMFVALVLCNGMIVEVDTGQAKYQKGLESADDKIRGGSRVENIKERPYVAYLQIGSSSQCTGSIITPLYVLTACHCLVYTNDATKGVSPVHDPLDKWMIIAGAVNIRTFREATLQLRIPQSFSHHPRCQVEPIVRNDAGLIKVSEPFNISENVQPVKLLLFGLESEMNDLFNRAKSGASPQCIVSGWGQNQYHSLADAFGYIVNKSTTPEPLLEDPFQLKTVTHSFLTDDQCLSTMVMAIQKDAPGFITQDGVPELRKALREFLKGFICGISKNMNESTCAGDSGSGYICDGSIIGVNSWGWGCGTSEPDVFQSLLPVLDWVHSELCTFETCQDAFQLHEECSRPSTEFIVACRGPEPDIVLSSSCYLALPGLTVLLFPLITQ